MLCVAYLEFFLQVIILSYSNFELEFRIFFCTQPLKKARAKKYAGLIPSRLKARRVESGRWNVTAMTSDPSTLFFEHNGTVDPLSVVCKDALGKI